MSNPPPVPSAHSARTPAGARWHALDRHLIEVARRAADNAAAFGGHDWARLAGLWHDLGKYRPAFQRYLRAANGIVAEDAHIEGGAGRVSHSTAGALLACDRFGTPGRVLAYLIACHHAGVYDWNSEFSSLEARLAASAPDTPVNRLRAHPRPMPPAGSLGKAPQSHMMTSVTDHEALSVEINAAEFKAKCLKLLDEVAATHEPLVITKRGRPVARLVPIKDDTAESLFGYLRGTVTSWATSSKRTTSRLPPRRATRMCFTAP